MNTTSTHGAIKTWKIDSSHSTAGFVARHMMITKVRGSFKELEGTLSIPEGSNVPDAIDATINTASVDTREEKRDAHLRSEDFFHAEKFPSITFKSEGIDAVSETDFEVTGLLTIRDVTKQVHFGVHVEGTGKDPWGNNRIAYSASLRINREDYGLTWNQALEAGGVLVGKEIDIELEVQAIPAG